MVTDRIVAATQRQLIGQTEWIIPIQTGAPLLLASGALAAVVARQADAPGFLRGVFDQHFAAAHFFAGRQLHLGLVRGQTVQLIHHLLDFAQVKQVTRFAWEAHGELAVGDAAALRALHAFQTAFHHLHLEVAAGEALLRQVGTTGDEAFGEVVVGDDLEQIIQLRYAQALANVRLEQAVALAFGEGVGTGEFNGVDGEAAGVGRC